MSNNYRFWSIVDQIKKTPLYAHANDDERSTLDQACKSALTNNVLTGIDFRATKYVTELFEILEHCHTTGQKSFDNGSLFKGYTR